MHFSRFVWIFALKLYVSKANLAFYSADFISDVTLFTKPFGVELQNSFFGEKGSFTTNQSAFNCTGHLPVIHSCNRTALQLSVNKTLAEKQALERVSANCSFGRYECLQNHVHRNSHVQSWVHKLEYAVKTLCENKCWKVLLSVRHQCSLTTERMNSELDDMNFTLELMNTLCEQPAAARSACASTFLGGLLKSPGNHQPCSVTEFIHGHCSSACDQELGRFYDQMGCCVGLVTSLMEKYNKTPVNNSFGVLITTGAQKCHRNYWTCPQQMIVTTTRPPTANPIKISSNNTNTTEATASPNLDLSKGSSSPSTKLIVGITVAVVICLAGVAILGKYMWQKIQNRQKIRFEDYGYSHLKMMENDLYDFEDEHDGLISL